MDAQAPVPLSDAAPLGTGHPRLAGPDLAAAALKATGSRNEEAAGAGHVRLELRQLRWLEAASLVEATTLVLLVGVAVPLKHLAGVRIAVAVMGPVHGLAFAAYAWTVLQTAAGGGWRRREWLRLLLAAFVPLAGYANLPLIRRKAGALAGAG